MVCICSLTYSLVNFIGIVTLIQFLYSLYCRFFKARNQNLLAKYGKGWCLVTGATDGIGKAYCEELAEQGFNICVFGRNKEKTKKVCSEIQQANLDKKIKVSPIIADFKNSIKDEQFIEKIKVQVNKAIGSDNVSILINNVGTEKTGSIREKSLEWYRDIISINIGSQTLMTKFVIDEYMKEDSTQKRAIINVSSFGSEVIVPNDAEYCGSKTYNDRFSRSLSYELKGQNIDVLSVKPLFVTTPLTGHVQGIQTGAIGPNLCAKESLKDLGQVHYTNGAPFHKFQSLLASLAPESFVVSIIPHIYINVLDRFKGKTQKDEKKQQ